MHVPLSIQYITSTLLYAFDVRDAIELFFRVALYKAHNIGWVGQKLYRVPGLSCDGFPGNGIGVIMAGTLISGRTMFATPACECRIRGRVLIE
jgi:hypothetical protein